MYTAEERNVALKRTVGSILGSALFGLIVVSVLRPPEAIMNYFTCYLMELSLSFDNVFAFYLVFKYFKTPKASMQRCLYWGWLTALALRGILIFTLGQGVLRFKWLLALFVPVLIFQGVRAVQGLDEDEDDPQDLSSSNLIVRLATRMVPVTETYHEDRFFVKPNSSGKLNCTPLFLTLVVIELTDVVFCVDSVPAQFAVTSDTFLIFWAVAFALLCLRSFFVLLSQFVTEMPVMQRYIGAVLIFIGFRLSLEVVGLDVPPWVSLCIVLGTIAGGAGQAAREKFRRDNGLEPGYDDPDDQQSMFITQPDGEVAFLNSTARQGGVVEEDELE
jgi:tellurite resistance protein TerC